MASIASACRLSLRLRASSSRSYVVSRGFGSSARRLAVHNFTMPAMSPTMTEGNIASWKVKEGDTFAAGDVLLEIETDKAQIEVEAQDDGIMAKITSGDGSKGIKVGTPIAITADPGDDISSLDLSAAATSSPQDETASGVDPNSSSPSEAEAPPSSRPSAESAGGAQSGKTGKTTSYPSPQDETAGGVDRSTSSESMGEGPPSSKPSTVGAQGSDGAPVGKPHKQTYPLYPSVEHLFHTSGLSKEDADKIPASGPNGRLLKGDVLAYLGKIQKSYPVELQGKISKREHLDLSNIKVSVPRKVSPEKVLPPDVPEAAAPEPDTEVAVPVSLSAVLQVQKRIQDTLGVFLPISTFITRAAEVANDDLPGSAKSKPSAEELFNQVLGLDKIHQPKTSRGNFIPQIMALPPAPVSAPVASRPAKKVDIIDILAGKHTSKASQARSSPSVDGLMAGTSASMNVFSVTVPKGDEKRAEVFLERVKMMLEAEPGRLIL